MKRNVLRNVNKWNCSITAPLKGRESRVTRVPKSCSQPSFCAKGHCYLLALTEMRGICAQILLT